MTPEVIANEENVYPGIWLAAGVKVDSGWQDTPPTDASNWEIKYDLSATIDLSAFKKSDSDSTTWTSSTFTYDIYRSDSQIATPITGCKRHEEGQDNSNETHLYYDGCDASALEDESVETISKDNPITLSDVNSGQIDFSAQGEKIDVTGEKYYYIVLKYANNASGDQSTIDAGKQISIKFNSTQNAALNRKTS